MATYPKEPKTPEVPDAVPADPTNVKPIEKKEDQPEKENIENQNIDDQQQDLNTQPEEAQPNPQLDMNSISGQPQDGSVDVRFSDIIRKYELKKIHSKLNSIDNFLYNNNNFSNDMIRIQKNVNTAIELFHFIIENLTMYKDKLDKIIEVFNKFIDEILSLLDKYSQSLTKKEKEDKNND